MSLLLLSCAVFIRKWDKLLVHGAFFKFLCLEVTISQSKGSKILRSDEKLLTSTQFAILNLLLTIIKEHIKCMGTKECISKDFIYKY